MKKIVAFRKKEMRKVTGFVLVLAMVLGMSSVALAYPTVGTDPQINLPVSYSSGAFQNYHYPNRYFLGLNEGFHVQINSATMSGVDIGLYIYTRAVSLGNGSTWQPGTGDSSAFNTSNLGQAYEVDRSSTASYYYSYKFTKNNISNPGSITIGYNLHKGH